MTKDYKYITAWFRWCQSKPNQGTCWTDEHLAKDLILAQQEDAPADALYKSSFGEWVRFNECPLWAQIEINAFIS